jgi:hypothetical protein
MDGEPQLFQRRDFQRELLRYFLLTGMEGITMTVFQRQLSVNRY